VKNWNAEILGYTAPYGEARVQDVVPLEDDKCVQAKFVTYRDTGWGYESVDVTKLVQADHVALEFVVKVTTRLAHEAYEAGRRAKQQEIAKALGVSLTPEGD
jgi:hypothetical protein